MNRLLTLVIVMGLVTWLTILAASLIRARVWTTKGALIAFGNRDDLPGPTPFAGRAERTARNTLENFVLFLAVALVAQVAGATSPRVVQGAEIFFWARVAFIPVYYAGIVYLRTAVWLVSIVGLGMMVSALL
ncbi:MAG: MAPEG family protein [Gammaproteobacteria bacterium]|nr:MAPEG family protein [Gammaproteobacteria bacterium]